MEAANQQAQPQPGFWEDAEIISVYTRAQAIADGVLVDVSKMAREAGFKCPVAVTRAVWDGYVTPDPRSIPYGQSIEGRLWDTLWMGRLAAARASKVGLTYYQLYYIMKARQRRLITLKMVMGLGDDGSAVITIMLPDED